MDIIAISGVHVFMAIFQIMLHFVQINKVLSQKLSKKISQSIISKIYIPGE